MSELTGWRINDTLIIGGHFIGKHGRAAANQLMGSMMRVVGLAKLIYHSMR
ncbi:hypothetical protein DO71_5248 [Burkholderia pseudomallei]|nr:hypothetical protein DO71_5248 [Burkholderia pseudomallei]KGD40238.1 hypothetical protein DO72_4483 [Burkholderia pseudomallei]